jgi:hypothetical protein
MKVTYEQAVRLKDAGFPQPGDVDQHSMDSRYENGVYVPALTELFFHAVPGKRLTENFSVDELVELYIAQKHNVN